MLPSSLFLTLRTIHAAAGYNTDKCFATVCARLVSMTVHLQKGHVAIVLPFSLQVILLLNTVFLADFLTGCNALRRRNQQEGLRPVAVCRGISRVVANKSPPVSDFQSVTVPDLCGFAAVCAVCTKNLPSASRTEGFFSFIITV